VGLIAWSLAVLVSIVYLGEHYVVDALAGYVFVAFAYLVVEAFTRWLARRQARAASTPATPSA
jgi:membrane-associated phospholipid phosphatase